MPLLWSRSALSSRLQLSRMEKMLEALTSQPGLSPVGRVDFVCLSNTASLNEPCEEARKRCRHPQFRKSPLNCHKTRVAYAAPGQVPLLCQLSRPLRGAPRSLPAPGPRADRSASGIRMLVGLKSLTPLYGVAGHAACLQGLSLPL